MNGKASLPGLHSPGASFEAPFEMLAACHERVQRMLDLLTRLRQYLQQKPCDDVARQAARDVLRYFDMAAPLHHQDEELHVFPLLLAQGGSQLQALVRQLQADHQAMEADWAQARLALVEMAEGRAQAFTPGQEALFECFASRYAGHIRQEEGSVYPAAQALLGDGAEQNMGQEMARRRGAR